MIGSAGNKTFDGHESDISSVEKLQKRSQKLTSEVRRDITTKRKNLRNNDQVAFSEKRFSSRRLKFGKRSESKWMKNVKNLKMIGE